MMDKIKLVDAIAHLRKEIQDANQAAQGEALKLIVESIEVDFGIEIEKDRKASGQLNFNVPLVSGGIGGGGGNRSKSTHSIRLRLKPATRDVSGGYGPVDVIDKDQPEDD
ncbi:MAG: trypco2 family protein [Alphaproteobacteria bacterium]